MKNWDRILQYFLIILLCVLVFAFFFNRLQKRNSLKIDEATGLPKLENSQSEIQTELAHINTIALVADRLCLKNSLCDSNRSAESTKQCAENLKTSLDFVNHISSKKFKDIQEFTAALQSTTFKNDIDRLAKCQTFIETTPCPIKLAPVSGLSDCDNIFLFDHF